MIFMRRRGDKVVKERKGGDNVVPLTSTKVGRVNVYEEVL